MAAAAAIPPEAIIAPTHCISDDASRGPISNFPFALTVAEADQPKSGCAVDLIRAPQPISAAERIVIDGA